MKIQVDRTICHGHAMCAHAAPEVYKVDDEGYCASDGETVPEALAEKARLGVRACPEGAITLIDTTDGRR